MAESNVHHVEVYRDVTESRWRWRAVARNGEIVSEGQAHTREEDAARAARGVFGEDIVIVRGGRGGLSIPEPAADPTTDEVKEPK